MNQDTLQDLLPLYYRRLFPYNHFYRWLSYGNVKRHYFQNREFSFTLLDDVYIRYQSFKDQKEWESAVQEKNPHKIDIGAVFSTEPKNHRQVTTMQPIEKELVFDIDMTDYDDVRICCSGADICTKCWKFMSIACKVLDIALRDDFGYEHLLWVFSGRRGIHCWVCDESARELDSTARSAVADYLSLLVGGENQAKKIKLDGDKMHHSIKRAKNIIEQQFVSICVEDQDMLGTPEKISKLFSLFPEEAQMKTLDKKMRDLQTSRDRWEAIVEHVQELRERGQIKKWRQYLIEEVMLQYAYPRLDINVSKGLNHLLKSPFCIHPKTGKVCIPFNPKAVEKLDPNQVPTLLTLVDEVKEFDKKEEQFNKTVAENGEDAPTQVPKKRIKDYRKTSLLRSINVFEEFLSKLEKSRSGQLLEASDKRMEF